MEDPRTQDTTYLRKEDTSANVRIFFPLDEKYPSRRRSLLSSTKQQEQERGSDHGGGGDWTQFSHISDVLHVRWIMRATDVQVAVRGISSSIVRSLLFLVLVFWSRYSS